MAPKGENELTRIVQEPKCVEARNEGKKTQRLTDLHGNRPQDPTQRLKLMTEWIDPTLFNQYEKQEQGRGGHDELNKPAEHEPK